MTGSPVPSVACARAAARLPPRNHGRFRPRGRADPAPLLTVTLRTPPKSAPHVRGWITRRAREAARCQAVLDALRAEIAERRREEAA